MRYTRFIAAVVALLVATSCIVDDIDNPVIPNHSGDKITVVGRITRFDDHVVDTRSTKDSETEGMLYNMAVALFPINKEGKIGDCALFEYKEGSEVLFTIDRQVQNDNNEYIYKTDTPYVMYVFANCTALKDFNESKTLEEMKQVVTEVKGIDIPENGFPMIGSLGDTVTPEGDGKTFILKPGKAADPDLPTIDGTPSELLTIPLEAMFAKVNFTIKVTADEDIPDKLASRFVLNSYTVSNVPNNVDFKKDNDNDEVIAESFERTKVTSISNVAIGANTVTFTFYLPERFLKGTIDPESYEYPFGELNNDGTITKVTGYSYLRDEDKRYAQRFKPELVNGKNATCVTLAGEYRDHQNHLYDVKYKIYLGEDNYGNFDVQRNREYFNYITIRGISATNDMTDLENRVSIDHRVDVERKSPVIISLRRETLLDSHIEVRPMRIRKSEEVDNMDELINAVKVEVVNPTTTNWMRLERGYGIGTDAQGKGIYITSGVSEGKRKYFTYNLVNGLSVDGKKADTSNYSLYNSTSVVVPLNEAGESIWIYVDENTNAADKDGFRSGTLRVTCGVILDDGTFKPTSVDGTVLSTDYVISQHALFPVTYNGHTYNIEYEEEYLHNFDAEDTYGQTEENGMAWGMNGDQLSSTYKAFFVEGSIADGIINSYISGAKLYYDFYLTRDIDKSYATRRDNAGFQFTTEIAGIIDNAHMIKSLGNPTTVYNQAGYNTDPNDDIKTLTLADKPRSAIEYCLNKNKRNADGTLISSSSSSGLNTDMVVWYLPAIDEIENIMMGAYTDFLVFQDKPYWSSQPAFYRGYGIYQSFSYANEKEDYYFDDKTSARATKVVYSSSTGFGNISSGVDGYQQIMDMYVTIFDMFNPDPPKYTQVTSDNFKYTTQRGNNVTIEKMTDKKPHPGNMLRTQKARVRCVRKAN